MELTDKQWEVIQPFIPEHPPRPDRRGRPRADDRQVMNGIFWIMRTGAAWQDLPNRYPSGSTCYRRFHEWCQAGALEAILEALAQDLEERGRLNLSECFIDGTFVPAKRGASAWARPSGAKVAKSCGARLIRLDETRLFRCLVCRVRFWLLGRHSLFLRH